MINTENNSDKIKDFESFLKEKLNSISELEGSDTGFFKQVLYVSFLDSLAACLYPTESSNRIRFIRIIEDYAEWPDKNRISLPHLAKFSESNTSSVSEKINAYVIPLMDSWLKRTNDTISLSEEPEIDAVITLIGCNACEKLHGSITLEHFKHINLFYQLRNALVHQFQSRFVELGSKKPSKPFYQVVQTSNDQNLQIPERIELVYPFVFLKQLTETVLNNATEYLLEKNINPFPTYYAGDYWISALNRD